VLGTQEAGRRILSAAGRGNDRTSFQQQFSRPSRVRINCHAGENQKRPRLLLGEAQDGRGGMYVAQDHGRAGQQFARSDTSRGREHASGVQHERGGHGGEVSEDTFEIGRREKTHTF